MAKKPSLIPPPGQGGGLMEKLGQMQTEMKRVQAELAEERMTISVGGDAVQIVIDGQVRVHHVQVAPEALAAAQSDTQLLEDLLTSAMNIAIERAQTLGAERLRGLSSGLGLPEL
ncbi:MAG: YbaB/EbfC family nucleoid-associated protein [Anaerolineales bacterium]|nr:YbaB/EbfC family nucleoid-associated protein [Anaerolineales bacterium]